MIENPLHQKKRALVKNKLDILILGLDISFFADFTVLLVKNPALYHKNGNKKKTVIISNDLCPDLKSAQK